jgi:hypothetical protein
VTHSNSTATAVRFNVGEDCRKFAKCLNDFADVVESDDLSNAPQVEEELTKQLETFDEHLRYITPVIASPVC